MGWETRAGPARPLSSSSLTASYYTGMEGVGSSRDELDGFDMRKSMPKDTVSSEDTTTEGSQS